MRAALLLAVSAACASAPPKPAVPPPPPESAVAETRTEGELIRSYDLNRDGKPDDWKFYKLLDVEGRQVEVLVRRELDANFDGKVDIWTWFQPDGTRSKEQFDLDFDGRVDVVHHYEKGVLARKETFRGSSDKPAQVTFFEGGKKVRVERDGAGKGRIDTWEYWEDGRLLRIGRDLDGDGAVDRWIRAREDEDEGPKKSVEKVQPPARP